MYWKIDDKMKIMSKSTKLILLYAISAILLEIVFFMCMDFGVFPKYFYFDLCAILIIVAIIYFAQNYILQSIIFWFLYTLQLLLCVANLVIRKGAGELFSLDMLALSKEGVRAFEPSFIDYKRTTIILVLYILSVFIYIVISKKKTVDFVYKVKNIPIILSYTLIFLFVGLSGYYIQSRLVSDFSDSPDFYVFESDKYLYENLTSKTDAYKKFGTFGFYIKNISNILSKDNITEEEKWDTAKYLANGRHVPSAYTGISEGNNVMTILLETMEYYAIDPYFTPNLYNIFFESKDTIKLNNFYANNRTNISEGLTLFGNYDKEYPVNTASDEVMQLFSKDTKFTLPAKLKEIGYNTSYYHDYCSWYYNRNITHSEAGFDEVIGLEKMDQLANWVDFDEDNKNPFYEWKNWTLDSEVMSRYFDKMTNSVNRQSSGNFFTHFSLITMHGNHQPRPQLQIYYDILTADKDKNGGHYDNMCVFLEDMGFEIPEDEEVLNYFLWYKSAAMDVDKMVGILIDNLKNTMTDICDSEGKNLTLYDTTTILFFADHNCYYNGLAYYMRDLDYSNSTYDTSLYKIPCVILDTKLSSKYYEIMGNNEMTKFTSTFNLLPTLFDVLGVGYNPYFYYGDSIFDQNTNVFQSNISGAPYFNDKFLLANNVIEWKYPNASDGEEYDFKRGALATYNRIDKINNLYRYPEILDMYETLLE